jgi:hypothetical protein
MHSKLVSAATLTLVLLGLTACGGGGGNTTPDVAKPEPTAVTLPAALFAASAPADAGNLMKVKTAAATGERVTFEARVGGSANPFVENRAIFSVVDPALLSCDQIHGDSCKRPWDYCCEPKTNLRNNMATVQVVDDAGQALKIAIQGQQGLEPLKTIVVVGTVLEKDDSGNFVVNAESIHIKEG